MLLRTRVISLALVFALALTCLAPAAAFADSEVSGRLKGTVWAHETLYDNDPASEGLEGISVRAYRWVPVAEGPSWPGYFEPPVITTTDAEGTYQFDGLNGGDYYQIAFADLTGTRRDVSYFQRGYDVADGDIWKVDSFTGDANAALPTLADLKAGRAYRVAGSSRYETALKISRLNFYSADTVILASGQGFADALAASPLAGVYDAPLLLTPTAGVPSGLITEIKRLFNNSQSSTKRVIIVGGTASVSNNVKAQLEGAGITVARIAGANRYDTSAKIAQQVQALNGYNDEPFVCRGDVFADALAVSPFAYADQRPILLTPTTGMTTEVRNAWKNMRAAAQDYVIFVGGNASITDDVWYDFWEVMKPYHPEWGSNPFTDVANQYKWQVQLYGDTFEYYGYRYGADRYGTAAAVVTFYGGTPNKVSNPSQAWPGLWMLKGGFDTLAVASGMNFPDALAGGVAAGANRAPLLLSPPAGLGAAAKSHIQFSGKYVVDMQLYGGASALSSTVETQAKSALGTMIYDIANGPIGPSSVQPSKLPQIGVSGGFTPLTSAGMPSAFSAASTSDATTERVDPRGFESAPRR